MSILARLRQLETRLYALVRHPQAGAAVARAGASWSPGLLHGHKYCLLVTYRRNGDPVATPVWFGLVGERLYFRSAASDGKIKRIRRRADVLVAPCTFRGIPLGAPMRGHARLLTSSLEEDRAERALQAHYGLGRRMYALTRAPLLEAAYVEVSAPALQR